MNGLFLQFILAMASTGITTLVLGIFVLIKNPRRAVNWTFACYSFAIAWWSFWQIGLVAHSDRAQALLWARIEQIGVFFIPTLMVHFVLSLLGAKRNRAILVCGYMLSVVLAGFSLTPHMMADAVPKFNYVRYFATPGRLYGWAVLFFFAYIVYGLWKLGAAYLRASGWRRNQLKYLFWSSLFGYLGGGSNFLLVYDISLPVLNPFGTYAVAAYVAVTAYAILRYRLLDITVAITRTGILIGLYGIIVGGPLIVGLVFKPTLAAWLGARWWLVPLGLYTVACFVGPFIYSFFQRKAEGRLLREQRRYQTMLLSAAKGMTQIHSLERLLKLLAYLLVRAMKLTHAGIYLWDEGQEKYILQVQVRPPCKARSASSACDSYEPLVLWLKQECAPVVREEIGQITEARHGRTVSLSRLESRLKAIEAAVVVPSFVNDRLIGFLALGNKRTGTMYSEDDLSMLQTLANQAALAIENAQFYEKERERQAELFHAASIADLGTMASSMSHQINNPLCIISGTAQTREEHLRRLLSQDNALPQALRQLLQDEIASLQSIQEEATAGSNIIATIRGITASTETARPLFLAEAIDVALPIAQHKVPFNRLDFRRELPDILSRIWGDKAQLAQCLISFLENAWDAIQARQEDRHLPAPTLGYKGLIRLAGSTVTEPDPSTKQLIEWVVLTISDNGIGLKPEDLRKLFIPFFTTKATAEKAFGSLFVVRRIIEAHGGTVSVDSTYGVGTTFKVKLPALTDEEVDRRMQAGRIAGNGPARPAK